MTEYEYASLIAEYNSNTADIFAVYLTIVSAYLIVAHVAGKALTILQVGILTSGFVIASALLTFADVSTTISAAAYAEKLRELSPDSPQNLRIQVAYFLGVVEVGGIFASLMYMWHVRRSVSR